MNRFWSLAVCLFAGASWAQPPEHSWALWAEPLSTLTLTRWKAEVDSVFVMVPLGLNLTLSPGHDLVFELTPLYTRQDGCGAARCDARALAIAVGSAWTFYSPPSEGHFFLQPKVVGVLAHDPRGASLETPFQGQVSLGLDVGYRLPLKHLFLAFMVGGSTGWGVNVPNVSPSLFFSLLNPTPSEPRRTRWVWDPNVHIFRIGASL